MKNQKEFDVIDFDRVIFETYNNIIPYELGIKIMDDRVSGVLYEAQKQRILLFEHEDIYTAGRMVNDFSDVLSKNIEIKYTDRGGKLTYHGPGQRVIYPILDLHYFEKDIRKYIFFLQSLIINVLYSIGINAHIDKAGVGVWTIKDNDLYKISAIGIRVKKWIAYHGIAINISNDLSKFDAIIPCGIKNYKHTSIKQLGIDIDFKEFDEIFIKEFEKMIQFYQSIN